VADISGLVRFRSITATDPREIYMVDERTGYMITKNDEEIGQIFIGNDGSPQCRFCIRSEGIEGKLPTAVMLKIPKRILDLAGIDTFYEDGVARRITNCDSITSFFVQIATAIDGVGSLFEFDKTLFRCPDSKSSLK